MGSFGKQDSEQETLHQGQFPLSNKFRLKECQSLSMNILGTENLETLSLYEFDGIRIASAAKASWAILLRAYIRTSYVSFGLLTNGKATDDEINHYQLSDHERLDKICAVDKRRACKLQCSDVDVNTGVDYVPNHTVVYDVAAQRQRYEQLGHTREVRLMPKSFYHLASIFAQDAKYVLVAWLVHSLTEAKHFFKS